MKPSVLVTIKGVSKWKVLRAVLCSACAKCPVNAVIIMKQGAASDSKEASGGGQGRGLGPPGWLSR